MSENNDNKELTKPDTCKHQENQEQKQSGTQQDGQPDDSQESISTQENGLETLLTVAMDEYHRERERSNGLDTKSGVFISALIAFLALCLPNIPFKGIKDVYSGVDKSSIVLVTIFLLVTMLGVIFISIAFYKLYRSFRPKGYIMLI